MKKAAAILLILLPTAAQGQAPTPKSFVGTVAGLRPDTAEIEVRSDAGQQVIGKITGDTIAQRIAPGEKDLKNADMVKVTDVAPGDRVLVTFEPGTTMVRRIVVMSAVDIAKRHEADRDDWQKRGVAGIVAAKSGNRITLKTRNLTGEVESIVTVDDRTRFKRYAPDSVKFSDARASKLAEVSVGDQLRARGEKNGDGLKLAAEEVVFGTFLVNAGTISVVHAESKEFTLKELGSNRSLTVVLTADSQLKQMFALPPGMMGGAPRSGMPIGAPATGGRGGMMSGPPRGGFDINQMLEHMPAVKPEDIKRGSTVVVSSTKGATSDQLTAIMVISNADMLIRMASMMSGSSRGAQSAGGMGGPGLGGPGMGGMSSGDLSGLNGLGLSGIMQ